MHTGKLSMVGNMTAFACSVHFRFLTYTILKVFFFLVPFFVQKVELIVVVPKATVDRV